MGDTIMRPAEKHICPHCGKPISCELWVHTEAKVMFVATWVPD